MKISGDFETYCKIASELSDEEINTLSMEFAKSRYAESNNKYDPESLLEAYLDAKYVFIEGRNKFREMSSQKTQNDEVDTSFTK